MSNRNAAIRRPPRPMALVLGLAVTAACAEAPEPREDLSADRDRARARVEEEIEDVYSAFSRAYARADIRMLLDSVYGDSAFYLPPGEPILQGKQQFRGQLSFLERYAREDAPGPEIDFEIVDRDYAGDIAYDIGTYTIRGLAGPAERDHQRGKFMIVWRRGNEGMWRIHANAFSPID